MKVFVVFLTIAAVGYASFIPPMVSTGFKPVAEQWHSSIEEDDEPEQYDQYNHDFEDYPKTIHVHEDHGHYDRHYFEDSHEQYPPPIVKYQEHPKTVHVQEVRLVKEPETVHVHEHHHHHHHHVQTLPVSIIKKTVYIKNG